ncbi:MAG: DUF2726 domain-containing protein [Verrucomicrobia bacterium]|nr:DUF2726 domain-containing protein [Verrucomicrobiota bacterium]
MWTDLARDPVFLACLVLVVGGLLALLATLGRRRDYPYVPADGLLTAAEQAFYAVLLEAAGEDYRVFTKVRFADIIRPEPGLGRKRYAAAFSRISSKHADFVLCDPATLVVLGVIELDDRSHERPSAQERDAFKDAALSAAGIPILRVPVARDYDAEELRENILQAFPGFAEPG